MLKVVVFPATEVRMVLLRKISYAVTATLSVEGVQLKSVDVIVVFEEMRFPGGVGACESEA